MLVNLKQEKNTLFNVYLYVLIIPLFSLILTVVGVTVAHVVILSLGATVEAVINTSALEVL